MNTIRFRSDPKRRCGPRRHARWVPGLLAALLLSVVIGGGCAKYNTFYNASRSFNEAETERKDRLKTGDDVVKPSAGQKRNYEEAIKKCQKVLDEYTGSGLTDDALFMMSKAYHRLNSYRMSIRKFDLLFTNFPATEFMEEALYLQALNHMFIGDVSGANELLERLNKNYPKSKFQADVLRSSGENSFVLEDWEEAAESYSLYIERYPDSEDRDQISLKLARCWWELGEYERGVELLTSLIDQTEGKELAFNARILLVRTYYQLDRYAESAQLIESLKSEAEIYQAQGEVALVEAENLRMQGKDDEAAAILENMPEEWQAQTVKPRLQDLLGRIYFRRWQLTEAQQQFQDALRGAMFLDEPELTRSLSEILRDYLAAEERLPDATPPEVPKLKLVQANALLFGMERPRLALDLYLEVANDAAVDSLTGARALYGAALVYGDYLALPDSSTLMTSRLLESYGQSPQAFLVLNGDEGDLLEHLLRLHREELQRAAVEPETNEAPSDTAVSASAPAIAEIDSLAQPLTSSPDSLPPLEVPVTGRPDSVRSLVAPAAGLPDSLPPLEVPVTGQPDSVSTDSTGMQLGTPIPVEADSAAAVAETPVDSLLEGDRP